MRFLDVGTGGFLGIGEKHFMIPVEAVAEVREDGIVMDKSREKVAGSPPFDTDVVPRADYQHNVYDHYGYPYPRNAYSGDADERPRRRATKRLLPNVERGRNRQGDDRPGAPRAYRGRTRRARAVPIGEHKRTVLAYAMPSRAP